MLDDCSGLLVIRCDTRTFQFRSESSEFLLHLKLISCANVISNSVEIIIVNLNSLKVFDFFIFTPDGCFCLNLRHLSFAPEHFKFLFDLLVSSLANVTRNLLNILTVTFNSFNKSLVFFSCPRHQLIHHCVLAEFLTHNSS
jgi:hypothetical protein